MKRVVVSSLDDGPSRVIATGTPPRHWQYSASSERPPHHNERELAEEPFGLPGDLGAWVAELWATQEEGDRVVGLDPEAFTDQPGVHSLEVPAGVTRFSIINFGPGYESKVHHTDSIDFDICLSGELDLVLETEVVRLEPGDVAILDRSKHAWRTATGATFAFVMISPHAGDGKSNANGSEHHGEQ
ncbi:MAG: cupin protein [Actinomycetia bacterium]|nr:cupin protein [Actinomycetes bacterium]